MIDYEEEYFPIEITEEDYQKALREIKACNEG
jgi:hypothetical protein